jgi:uncharacterized protein
MTRTCSSPASTARPRRIGSMVAGEGPDGLTVHQHDWANPTPEAWEAEVAGAVLQHPGAILVAHSLGCLVVARLLAKWPQLNIAGALLVAPADPGRSRRLERFADTPRGELPARHGRGQPQ